MDEARARLEALVSINTHSHNVAGLTESAAALGELFSDLGEVTVEPIDPVRDFDQLGEPTERQLGPIVRVSRPAPGPQVLLIGHHDTVFSPDTGFPLDFGGDTITGPGVADAKGGLVQMWLALGALHASGRSPGWELLIIPDEEIGSPGSAGVTRAASRRADLGFGFEPALPDGGIAAGRPGSGNFTIVIRGRAAHAGREHEKGRNAVVAAAEVIQRIAALTRYPDLLANPGVVSGGTAVNIVPDRAVVRVNVRVMSSDQAARVGVSLAELVADVNGREGFNATIHGGFGRPPKPRTPAYEALLAAVVETAAGLGLTIAAADTGGVCDGNLMADEGLLNVDNLGPVGGNLHRVGEYLDFPSVAERAMLTATLLSRVESLPRKDHPA